MLPRMQRKSTPLGAEQIAVAIAVGACQILCSATSGQTALSSQFILQRSFKSAAIHAPAWNLNKGPLSGIVKTGLFFRNGSKTDIGAEPERRATYG